MAVEIRAARPEDAGEICSLLHEHMNPSWPVERWRRILEYPWRPHDADLGRVVVDTGRIVGFLGLVYADRRIGGKVRRFANLTSWYLLRHLRGTGIGGRMLRHATSDPDITYTNLTPARATIALVRRAGFDILDEERLLFRRGPKRRGHPIEVADGRSGDLPADEPGLRRILKDHAGFDLRHVAFVGHGGGCHLLLQTKRKAAARLYAEVLFASDHEALARHARDLADTILTEAEAVLAIDRRFLPGVPSGALVEKLPQPRLGKLAGVRPAAVDMLYSEIPLLNLKLP